MAIRLSAFWLGVSLSEPIQGGSLDTGAIKIPILHHYTYLYYTIRNAWCIFVDEKSSVDAFIVQFVCLSFTLIRSVTVQNSFEWPYKLFDFSPLFPFSFLISFFFLSRLNGGNLYSFQTIAECLAITLIPHSNGKTKFSRGSLGFFF